ncbi:MAG: 2-oxoacid:acceptor oxidoreductase family protein [Spirochaetota bacterium]
MIKLDKPESFYKTFERKGSGQETTHYCPGCGHGTVHKIVAEAVDDLCVQDRTIFCSPVGCSVFGYYYFDTGNIQCAHGRAPAVATAIRRVHRDAIVISYQGDGDLAGIGTAEIIHAANRGENITVIFVNNAIYGMTGGQMAPTTLPGQKTMTTPTGRIASDGGPIGMAEIMDAIPAPVYVERVSLGDANRVLKARKAIRKALQYQANGAGFSFVEVLSPCPINWKKSPVESRQWLIENLEPVFPLKKFRDRGSEAENETSVPHVSPNPIVPVDDETLLSILTTNRDIPVAENPPEIREQRVKIAGFGGQGVLSAGVLLANCAISEGLHATWLPSYGPEMRGGTANASVIVSPNEIGSPLVTNPTTLIAMNGPSLDAFESQVARGGLIVANKTLIEREIERDDVRVCMIPASQMAKEIGFQGAANVILLTAYAVLEGFPSLDVLRAVIPQALKKKEMVDINLEMVEAAKAFVEGMRE